MIETGINIQRLGEGSEAGYRMFVEGVGLEPIVVREGPLGLLLTCAYGVEAAFLFKQMIVGDTGRFIARPWLEPARLSALRGLMHGYAAQP